MSGIQQQDVQTRLAEASAWVARLQGEDLSEADGLAFDAWLDAAPENRAAYSTVLAAWHELGHAAPQILGALDAAAPPLSIARPTAMRPSPMRRGVLAVGGLAAAAALAVVLLPRGLMAPEPTTYATAKGQHLAVKLADGSSIDMNAETRLTVSLGRQGRQVAMGEGEAIFDVAADSRRPFEIATAGRVVRVVGTQFDVRSRPDGLAVIVARGVVQVRPQAAAPGEPTYVLRAGQQLDMRAAGGAPRVSAVDPSEAFGWRYGRLVYRDEPLSRVVADLNRQFAEPIRLEDPALGESRVSGVLIVDDQAQVLQRLSLMLPIKTVRSDRGVLLQSR